MPTFEALFFIAVFALIAGTGLLLLVTLRGRQRSPAVELFEAGRFAEALAASGVDRATPRDELLAGLRAARHLLETGAARERLDRLFAEDPEDGEAWLEAGLVETWSKRPQQAVDCFDRVGSSRADLLESLTLHRAFTALLAGDEAAARRQFEEVEAALETKLRADLDGDPAFAEWFLQAGWLWRSRGDEERAVWAIETAADAAPESRLPAAMEAWRSPT